jgi:hypothetical protein
LAAFHPPVPLAEAIRYALARLPALTRFLDDGRIELDNNPVERAIRPIALGRKNHLFAGWDGGGVRWATICSLTATAKLNNVEPFAWLSDVLQRMTDGQQPPRRTLAVELAANKGQSLSHVQAMDVYHHRIVM